MSTESDGGKTRKKLGLKKWLLSPLGLILMAVFMVGVVVAAAILISNIVQYPSFSVVQGSNQFFQLADDQSFTLSGSDLRLPTTGTSLQIAQGYELGQTITPNGDWKNVQMNFKITGLPDNTRVTVYWQNTGSGGWVLFDPPTGSGSTWTYNSGVMTGWNSFPHTLTGQTMQEKVIFSGNVPSGLSFQVSLYGEE